MIVFTCTCLLHHYSREFKKIIRGFRDDAIKAFTVYEWPGNVRELENRIKRAVVMSDAEWLSSYDLDLMPAVASVNLMVSLQEAREELERRMINEALSRSGSNITHAAKDLGISRQTLTDMIKKYGIPVK